MQTWYRFTEPYKAPSTPKAKSSRGKKDQRPIVRDGSRHSGTSERRLTSDENALQKEVRIDKEHSSGSMLETTSQSLILRSLSQTPREHDFATCFDRNDGAGEHCDDEFPDFAPKARCDNPYTDASANPEPQQSVNSRKRAVAHSSLDYQSIPHEPSAGLQDPFTKYPVIMSGQRQRMIHHFLQEDSLRGYRQMWYPVAVKDPACFYQILSVAASDLEERYGGTNEFKIPGTVFYNKAIQSVNNRLSDSVEGTSDGVVASVLCLAVDGGAYERWPVHMSGLKVIIQKCGGLDSLDSNHALRVLLFRSDVAAALAWDAPPFFPAPFKLLPDMSSLRGQYVLPDAVLNQSRFWNTHLPQHSDIMVIFEDTLLLTQHFSDVLLKQGDRVWNQNTVSWMWIIPLMHRLLSLPRLAGPTSSAADILQDVLRHGLLVFLQAIRGKLFYTRFGLAIQRLHVGSFSRNLAAASDASHGLEPLFCFIIMCVGTETLDQSDREYLAVTSKHLMQRSGGGRVIKFVQNLWNICLTEVLGDKLLNFVSELCDE